MAVPKPTLLIACGALAREINDLIRLNDWQAYELVCLPAKLHNFPEKIVPAMRDKISEAKTSGKYRDILCLYGDCGTGGELDNLLAEENIRRIPGPHCYAFYTGLQAFEELAEEELGTFYLTDYLARFFERLIMEELGINDHPELIDMYFGNYKRLVYLAQIDDPAIEAKAKQAAEQLGLKYEKRSTGYGELRSFLNPHATEDSAWQN